MNSKGMVLVMALLMGTAAMMFLPGCTNPLATASYDLQGPQHTRVDEKKVHDDFFYQKWDNGKTGGSITYTNLSMDGDKASRYKLTWNSTTSSKDYNFVCGKGWGTWTQDGVTYSSKYPARSDRVVSYTGTFSPDKNVDNSDYGNCYLDFYGWGNNYDIEYYVLESYGEYSPASPGSGYTHLRDFDYSNGTHYEIYYKQQNGPSPKGSGTYTFDQIYSVRVPRLEPGSVAGEICLQEHIDEWSDAGYTIYSQQFQVMATEGFVGEYPEGTIRPVSGNSDITVIDGVTSTGIGGYDPPVTPSGYPETRVALKARYNNQYLCADLHINSNGPLIANRSARGSWETYYMVDLGNGKVALRAQATGKYVCAENAGSSQAVANRSAINRWETFDFGTISYISNGITLRNNAWSSDGSRARWYLRFDGLSQQYVGMGCIFYIEPF